MDLVEEPKLADEKPTFIPRPPEYKGSIDAVAWSIFNSSGKEIGLHVQIGGKDGLRFKLMRGFL